MGGSLANYGLPMGCTSFWAQAKNTELKAFRQRASMKMMGNTKYPEYVANVFNVARQSGEHRVKGVEDSVAKDKSGGVWAVSAAPTPELQEASHFNATAPAPAPVLRKLQASMLQSIQYREQHLHLYLYCSQEVQAASDFKCS